MFTRERKISKVFGPVSPKSDTLHLTRIERFAATEMIGATGKGEKKKVKS